MICHRCNSKCHIAKDCRLEGMSRPCCGDGMVTVSTEEGSSAKISVLVVSGKPLRSDLQLGINAIKALGGMVVGPTGLVTTLPQRNCQVCSHFHQ